MNDNRPRKAAQMAERLKEDAPGVHYLRFGAGQEAGVRAWMASEEERKETVRKLFPASEYEWREDESVLWNWINAHADRYFDGDYNSARRMVNDASDPIFGGKSHKAIAAFIWYLA